jgi:hypothetical protein
MLFIRKSGAINLSCGLCPPVGDLPMFPNNIRCLPFKSYERLAKYNPGYSKWFVRYSFMHIHIVFLLVCFLFFRFGEITKADALLNGIILLLAIFGFTSMLDKKHYGFIGMLLTSIGIAVFVLVKGDWFGLNTFVPFGSVIVAAYFTLAALIVGWFYKTELLAFFYNPFLIIRRYLY